MGNPWTGYGQPALECRAINCDNRGCFTTSSRPRFMRLSRVFFATETEIEPRGSSSDCSDASLGTVDARVGHCPRMLSTNQSARVNPRPLRMSACDDGSSMEIFKGCLDEFKSVCHYEAHAHV